MSLNFRVGLGIVAIVAAVACSSKDNSNNTLTPCGADGSCPTGFVCQTSSDVCVMSSTVDASLPDTRVVPPDTALPDTGVVPPDAGPPDTTITQAPPALTNQTVLTFTFTGTATTAKFQCRVDTEAFADCTTPFVTMLPQHMPVTGDGPHLFDVRAVDAGGNADPTPAEAKWTLDTTAPDTTITSGPSGSTSDTSATFTFTSNETGSTFTCTLDGGTPVACNGGSQTYPTLAPGSHTFTVAATDPAGNVDPSPATQTWTIALPLPTVTILSGPAPLSSSPMATFSFSATPSAGSTFLCSLDNASFVACMTGQEYNGLHDGSHTFSVEAVDANGTSAPAIYNWMIDSTGIVAVITGGPNGVGCASATFTFAAAGTNVTFQCELDNSGFATCSGGTVTYTGLVDASMHTFTVHAVGSDGTVGPDASQSFTVDAHPPNVSISAPANGDVTGKNTTLTFSADANTTVTCDVDGTAISGCHSGVAIPAQADGKHTVNVTATDNVCMNHATASSTWTVDTIGPTVTIAQPSGSQHLPGPDGSFTFSTGPDPAGLPPKTIACAVDGAAVTCTLGGSGTYSVPDGTHTLTITVTDALGNSTTTSVTFVVDSTPPLVTQLTATNTLGGNATVNYALTDESDVTSVHCVLDGVDIECGESASGGWNYSGLTPGVHVLDVYGIDQVGNSGQSATPGAVPTTRAEITFTEVYDTGRVVLIGHPDLYEEDWQDIFANAIRTSEPTLVRLAANKAPRILAFQPAGIDAESCDDMVEAIGFDVEGVDGDFDCENQSDYPAGYTTLNSPAGLATALRGADVFIVPDYLYVSGDTCDDGRRPQQALPSPFDLGALWYQTLLDFVNAGGVVIVLDGATECDGDYEPDFIEEVLTNNGQREAGRPIDHALGVNAPVLLSLSDPESEIDNEEVWQSDDLLVGPTGQLGEDDNGVEFVNFDRYGVNVYVDFNEGCGDACQRPIQARRPGDINFGDLESTVIEKPFPDPVQITVLGDCQSFKGVHQAQVLIGPGNGCPDSFEPVAFVALGSDIIDHGVIHTDPNGIAIRNMPNGGSVTAAAESGFDDGESLVSFLGVKPLDTLTIGVFPEENGNEQGTCDITVTLPESGTAPPILSIGVGEPTFDFGVVSLFGEELNDAYFIGPSGDIGPSGEMFTVGSYVTTNAAFAVARDVNGANPSSYVVMQGTPGDGEDSCPDENTPIQLPDYDTWTTIPPASLGSFTVSNLETTEEAQAESATFWNYTDDAGLDYPEVETAPTPYENGGSSSVQVFAPDNTSGMWVGTYEVFQAAQESKVDINETTYQRRTSTLDSSATLDFTTTLPYLGGFSSDFSQDGSLPVLSWQQARPATMDGQIGVLSWQGGEVEWDFVMPDSTSLNVAALLPNTGAALLPTNDANQNLIRVQFGELLGGLSSESNLDFGVISLRASDIGTYDQLRQGLPDILQEYLDPDPNATAWFEVWQNRGEQVTTSRALHKPSLAQRFREAAAHPGHPHRLTGRVVHAIPTSTFPR